MPGEGFKQRARNCILLTITVICICVIVLCGVMIVREYSLAKDYEPVTCRITNVTYLQDLQCTFCESKDKTKEPGASACLQSKLPCIHIGARYYLRGVAQDAQLHPDSIQAAGVYGQCSFSVCLKWYEDNKQAVSEFSSQWEAHKKRDTSFNCFYNTKDLKTIIVKKMHTKSDVIHSMLWPGIIIIICGIIFLRLEMQRRGMGFCEPVANPTGRRAPPRPCDDQFQVATNGDSAMLRGSDQEAKQTLLQLKSSPNQYNTNQKIGCSLLKNQGVISYSMTTLDQMMPPPGDVMKSSIDKDRLAREDCIGSTLSVDTARLQIGEDGRKRSTSANSTTHGQYLAISANERANQDKLIDCQSSTGSQGSKIMGLETPV